MSPQVTPVSIGMVESAVDLIIEHLKDQLNGYIGLVYEEMDDKTINLPIIPANRYFISEGISPLQLPSVFVVADRSNHDLAAQNFAAQEHNIFVGLVTEDLEAQRLQRKVWRYAKALWLSLHDQPIGNLMMLVRSLDYGPTIQSVVEQTGARNFQKDVVLRCQVEHYERFR